MVALSAHLERILEAACSAPSRDNLQPWRFTVDADDTISFGVDHSRERALGMARVAVGAAVECACVAAARMGATVRFQPPREGALVTISVGAPKRLPDPDLARTRRATNRKLYDGRALDDATWQALHKSTPARDLAETHWFGRERVRALGPLVEQAEELFWRDARLREDALAAVRFDVKDRDVVDRGLSVGSLELSAGERAALAEFRRPVGSGSTEAAIKLLAARARRQMESASGVLLVTAKSEDPAADVDVGRAMQRAWMTLTQKGIAAQPMTAVVALGQDGEGAADVRVVALLEVFRAAFPHLAPDARVAFVMRFGYAEPPTVRAGRMPPDESIRET